MPTIKALVPVGDGIGVVLDMPEGEEGCVSIYTSAEVSKLKKDVVSFIVGELNLHGEPLTEHQLAVVRDSMQFV